jgi:DNA-binding transcriptional regulator YdaS (Cro superfamily)
VHRAPRSLVGACRRAARDEARHARACGTSRPARSRRATPSLEALAIDNAIEGEVRETWGAAVGAWQAHTATSPAIRRVMRGIAPDELRHAELAARLGRFYASRLSSAARARVAEAKARAIGELEVGELPAPLAMELGLPSREASAALLAGLRTQVWRA